MYFKIKKKKKHFEVISYRTFFVEVNRLCYKKKHKFTSLIIFFCRKKKLVYNFMDKLLKLT